MPNYARKCANNKFATKVQKIIDICKLFDKKTNFATYYLHKCKIFRSFACINHKSPTDMKKFILPFTCILYAKQSIRVVDKKQDCKKCEFYYINQGVRRHIQIIERQFRDDGIFAELFVSFERK